MKKNIVTASVCAAVIIAVIALILILGGKGEDAHVHRFSDEWTYDETYHWRAAVCGHSDLTEGKAEHGKDSEVIIKEATDTETGLAEYTCGVCGYKYEEIILISTEVIPPPTVSSEKVYIGQKLSSVTLSGGQGSVAGAFSWADGDTVITESGEYTVRFTPDGEKYGVSTCKVYIAAEQLTVTVAAGENGIASPMGTVNVNYDSSLTVSFMPNLGYAVDTVTADGKSVSPVSKYTFADITESHTLSVSFKEGEMTVDIVCIEGADKAYTISGNTVTFTEAAANSIYAISGEMLGNIVIDVGDEADFELELRGLSLTSNVESAITVKSGDKVTLTAKKEYESFIYDVRDAVPEDDENAHSAAVYSFTDLDIGGKGSLTVESENNNGIHTKDDLEIKNLTLTVKCEDNALKGNDSVTILSGNITLIARTGDGIKTSNSDISEKGNQRGDIAVSGGTLNIYATCDGIDASHDVIIDESEGAAVINVFTDRYSEYSESVEKEDGSSDGLNYISFSSSFYKFSVKYYNGESDYLWVNAEYHSQINSGRSTYYFFSYPDMPKYSKIKIFMYGDQEQGQEEDYILCSDYMTPNDTYDTFALTYRNGSFYYNWTDYSSYSKGGMGGPGGMGGMQDGNSDKGEYSTKGIKAANEITVNAGTVNIRSYDDAFHANSENELENGKTAPGHVNITGGKISVYSNDDGIHADGTVNITGGSVNVTNCYEVIEGSYVNITDGEVSVISKDDGINATSASGTGISIGGGTLYIYAGGDGIDSNSRASYSGAVFSGGKTVVICASGGNSAIDTEQGYSYTGGYVLAVTASSGGMGGGMEGESYNCKNFSSVGTKTNISLSSGKYLEASIGKTNVTLKMPCSLSAAVICLGSTDTEVSQVSSSSASLDANGVYWS